MQQHRDSTLHLQDYSLLLYHCATLTLTNVNINFTTVLTSSVLVVIELLYWPARLQRLAEVIPWNQFLGSLKV
jgi:hypothetical protein